MKRIIAAAAAAFITVAAMAQQSILIKGGTLYDGSENAPAQADVLIKGDRILAVGSSDSWKGKVAKAAKQAEVIDATGLVVAPGFIDPHTHINGDLATEKHKFGTSYLRMGVTTAICGMCGSSPLPLSKQADKLLEQGTGLNVAYCIGLGSVRNSVIGKANRKPKPTELEQMKQIVKENMEWGAFGVSSGLIYSPGFYAKTAELIELTKMAAPYGGIYTTHMRGENTIIMAALEEALTVGKEAGVAVNISHIKCAGEEAHGKSDSVINRIVLAQQEGMKVTADQYPYDASSTSLKASVMPKYAASATAKGIDRMCNNADTLEKIKAYVKDKMDKSHDGADYIISPTSTHKDIKGKNLAEIAQMWNMTSEEAVIEILRKRNPSIVKHTMSEYDIRNFMKQPWVMTCTDGSIGGHPRAYGSFTRKIKHYVNEEHVITLDEAIRRCTGLVADTYGLKERGYVRPGYYADVVVFNPETITDRGTYTDPQRYSKGFKAVIVNGQVAVKDDEGTKALAGMIIKRESK